MARRKKGAALVKLMIAFTIAGIAAAIAVPSLTAYIHHAQFQRNRAYAQTIYLDAEANLAHLRAAGLWEDFQADLRAAGETVPLSESGNPEAHEICGVIWNGRTPEGGIKERVIERLAARDTSDGGILKGEFCIEVDLTSGHIWAVFYSASAGALCYEPGTDGYLGDRTYDSLLERRLGFCSAETQSVEKE